MKKRQKIVLLHGLFMSGALLSPLRRRLLAQGFDCRTFSYASIWRTSAENAARLTPAIQAFAAGENVYFVGHSLGGLVLRHLQQQAPELFQNSQVITLGTPHQGSRVAAAMRPLFGALLKRPWQMALDGKAPVWPPDIPLLSVAGTQPRGIGALLRIFTPEEGNDGTVAEAETQLAGACATQTIAASHTFMLYQKETATLIGDWFRANQKPASV